ncbi:LLM class flavin-dependent oxidoreductase [Microbacterium sp. A84]|uniref:LLM class flavin-dependent oxidoreductase n=1 Tax=Microbacterium sp. A84 TaxID=3450715 RepID=UPI003F443B07
MKLGAYVRLACPRRRPWSWSRHHGFILEACEEVERLGADSVWLTEHHGFDDVYLPQPLVYTAAVAARTSRVRIGTAAVSALFRHPRHLTEEAAVVDAISGGRLDLGIGASNRPAEDQMFGSSAEAKVRRTVDVAEQIRALVGEESLTPARVRDGVRLGGGSCSRLLPLRDRRSNPCQVDGHSRHGLRSRHLVLECPRRSRRSSAVSRWGRLVRLIASDPATTQGSRGTAVTGDSGGSSSRRVLRIAVEQRLVADSRASRTEPNAVSVR